jgi:hypothetical protein
MNLFEWEETGKEERIAASRLLSTAVASTGKIRVQGLVPDGRSNRQICDSEASIDNVMANRSIAALDKPWIRKIRVPRNHGNNIKILNGFLGTVENWHQGF